MKRDMDLVREILLAVEAGKDPWGTDPPHVDGHSDMEVGYHLTIMRQAGLVEAFDVTGVGSHGKEWEGVTLTWNGHEFLDAARDDTIWTTVKGKVAKLAGTVTFVTLCKLLTDAIEGRLGLA